jgi:hypothetical protein
MERRFVDCKANRGPPFWSSPGTSGGKNKPADAPILKPGKFETPEENYDNEI